MSIWRLLVFPTFVVTPCLICALVCALGTSAFAAKSSPPPNLDDVQEEVIKSPKEKELRKAVDIAPMPPAPPRSAEDVEYFYPYRTELGFHTGFVYDTRAASENIGFLTLFGARYLFTLEDRRKFEIGTDLLSDGSGIVEAVQHFVYWQGRFRPFSRAGVGVRIAPGEQLATFLKYENYQLRGSIGFEDVVRTRWSFRLELQAMASLRSQGAAFLVGGNYAW